MTGIKADFLLRDGSLNTAAWQRALEAGEHVATCRHIGCKGVLVPTPTHRDGFTVWHNARCGACGGELAIPEGKVLARSSRHGEMPPGWWTRREESLKKRAAIEKEAA